jgi:acyl-coenzyme A synthetase/AMP-(fatty) acid ligase
MNDWFDHILYNTREQPEMSAIVLEDRVVTYGMLGAAIESCAHRLAALNLATDRPVAVSIGNPIRHLTVSFALFRIGICSLPLDRPHHGIPGLEFDIVLGDAEAKPKFASAHRFIEVTDAWFATDVLPSGRLPAPFSGERQVCRRSLTSGTTGEPKIFGNTIGYIGRHIFPGIGVFNCSLVLSMPGLTTIWGFMVACAVLATRKTLCCAVSPFQAIRMIELFSIDFVLASPDQVVALVRAARKSGAQVPSLRTVAIGGAIPTRALLEGAAIYLCKDIRCRYGTSEVGLLAETAAREILSKPGFVGRAAPGFEIAVFDSHSAPCRSGELGIVKARVKRDSDREQDAWTDHGDVGWITDDGQLFIVGRTSDIADLSDASAREVSPVHEVEHLLRLEWDATDAAAVLVLEETVGAKPEIWVATVDCKDARADQLQAILRHRGIEGTVRLFAVSSIPRAANGKVQRAQLQSLMLARAGEPR